MQEEKLNEFWMLMLIVEALYCVRACCMAVLLDGQTQARAQMVVNVVCARHYTVGGIHF